MKIDNIESSFDKDRQVLGERYPLDTPFNVILDASERCQFKCNYCFRSNPDKSTWGYPKNNDLMEWDIFVKAVDQIKLFPEEVKQISLSNHGEPLLNRQLPDMVKYIKKQGIKSRVSIHTNGALLDHDYAIKLAESNIDKIVVSLQGLNSRKYAEVCGAQIDFDRFISSLKVLYDNKQNTQICIKIADVALDGESEDRFYELFSPIADKVFVERIVPIWENLLGEDGLVSHINKYGETFPLQESCILIFHTIVIAPNGDIYPCTQPLSPYVLGNVNSSSLLECWNSDERKDLLIRQCKNTNPDICKNCYISQNSIYAKEDLIDDYRDSILSRIINN